MKQIYVIKNIINDKVYVGQAKSAYDRFRRHKNNIGKESKRNIEITQAMAQLGSEKFYFVILEECADEMADERERFYIKQFDSYKNGYNNTTGGFSFSKLTDEEINKCCEMLLNGMTITEITDEIKADHHAIKRELMKRLPNYKDLVNRNAKALRVKTARTPVNQYDLEGNYIRTFKNAREALLSLGLSPKIGGIAKCCRHAESHNTSYGYRWEYAE